MNIDLGIISIQFYQHIFLSGNRNKPSPCLLTSLQTRNYLSNTNVIRIGADSMNKVFYFTCIGRCLEFIRRESLEGS